MYCKLFVFLYKFISITVIPQLSFFSSSMPCTSYIHIINEMKYLNYHLCCLLWTVHIHLFILLIHLCIHLSNHLYIYPWFHPYCLNLSNIYLPIYYISNYPSIDQSIKGSMIWFILFESINLFTHLFMISSTLF